MNVKSTTTTGLLLLAIGAFGTSALGSEPRLFFASNRDGLWASYCAGLDGSDLRRVGTLGELSESSHLAWSADGTRIAYSDRGKLMRMNADGKLPTQITQDATYEEPAWSPDAKSLAMTSTRDITGTALFGLVKKRAKEIYSISTAGAELTRLTNNTSDDYAPAWSPDGSRLAFVSKRDGNAEIYVMNSDGSKQTRITSNKIDDEDPAWSPDGGRLAFASHVGDTWVVNIVDANGANQMQLTVDETPSTQPSWAPDGSAIAYKAGANIAVISLYTDSEATVVCPGPHTDLSPSWAMAEVLPVKPYQLSGRAVDIETNRGIPGTRIAFSDGRRSTLANTSGAWAKDSMTQGVTVTASRQGWAFSPATHQVVPDLQGRVNAASIVFEAMQYYTTSGSVADTKGKGIADVVVRYRYHDVTKGKEVTLYTLSGPEGQFTLPDLTGPAFVRLQKDGWTFDSRETRVGAGSSPRFKGMPAVASEEGTAPATGGSILPK